MHVTEVPDNGVEHVRTQMAMEFIRLVKLGKLPEYQRRIVDEKNEMTFSSFMFNLGKFHRSIARAMRGIFYQIFFIFHIRRVWAENHLEDLRKEEVADLNLIQDHVRWRKVRDRADKIIDDWQKSSIGVQQRRKVKKTRGETRSEDGTSLASEQLPKSFIRAQSARNMLNSLASDGALSEADRRSLGLANITAAGHSHRDGEEPLVDEETLSLQSFFDDPKTKIRGDYDKRKRTLLERMFAVDRSVRKGRLTKHMTKEKLATIMERQETGQQPVVTDSEGPRAIVIEGAALKHLLGDPEMQEILFAVASNCEAVIACRASPKQKALLVNLVRNNVVPEPVTLAIGDGANDVGMIQEAHVGVGISGKEGKQAVNASDFAIAQFRFLESLILIHGRWDFLRLSTVVLFSFYKNAAMVGHVVIFTGQSVFSGTPLFDEWMISVLNFVCAFPILLLGLFDRSLSKEYVRKHPETYDATRNNESMAMRMRLRWIGICFVHIFSLYYMSVLPHQDGGGYTSAYKGLMSEDWSVGDGEGGDLKSVGTVAYTNIVVLLGYKVLYECKSIIHGHWPAFTCRKDVGEGFFSRVAWTWQGVLWGSFLFYAFFISVYNFLGVSGAGLFSDFVGVGAHVFRTRTLSWLLLIFVPLVAMLFDVALKVFSNMYYPTQTQIHLESELSSLYAICFAFFAIIFCFSLILISLLFIFCAPFPVERKMEQDKRRYEREVSRQNGSSQ